MFTCVFNKYLYNLKIFPLLFINIYLNCVSEPGGRESLQTALKLRKLLCHWLIELSVSAKPLPLWWCHYEQLWFFSEHGCDVCVQVWQPVYPSVCMFFWCLSNVCTISNKNLISIWCVCLSHFNSWVWGAIQSHRIELV